MVRDDRYLFRGKIVDNGEWVIGSLDIIPDGRIEIGTKCIAPPDCDPMWQKVLITHEVIPETVGQCTGLKDKNGKLIFEGDILKLGTGKTRFVFYGVSGFRHTTYNGYAKEFDFKDKGYQVIGNIHDNPELLEVKE